MLSFIKAEIEESRSVLQRISDNPILLATIEQISAICVTALKAHKKILFCGNGGSAADAQHLAAELVGRFGYHRPGLAAIALTTDTSALTAIGNDYSFEQLFSRQVEALGQPGDVLFGISTSGKSPNVLKAFDAARAQGLITIGLTGQTSPLFDVRCDQVCHIPSTITHKIQESHLMVGHIICAGIENTLFGKEYNPREQHQDARLECKES